MAKLCSDQASRGLNLFDIRGTRRHRRGEAVCGENKVCVQALVNRDIGKARLNKFCPGLDEQGMIVPSGTVSDLRRFSTQFHARVGDDPDTAIQREGLAFVLGFISSLQQRVAEAGIAVNPDFQGVGAADAQAWAVVPLLGPTLAVVATTMIIFALKAFDKDVEEKGRAILEFGCGAAQWSIALAGRGARPRHGCGPARSP